MGARVALKIDVDTDRGTRIGVPALQRLLLAESIPACFLFSLGRDNTGRAITRIFRPGFFSKVSRTSVVSTYGLRTLLNGTLLPAPHIGRRNEPTMRAVRDAGFEVGIHCNDHYRWQDHLFSMSLDEVRAEFGRAQKEFVRIFGFEARTAGAAGWQASAQSKKVYDEANLLYASDTRGTEPCFVRADGRVFSTLEIPTTLPTLDELLGRTEYPVERIPGHLCELVHEDRLNVFTLHAEIEGMAHLELFRSLLAAWKERGVEFVRLDNIAGGLLRDRGALPARDLTMAAIDGRSGLVAVLAG